LKNNDNLLLDGMLSVSDLTNLIKQTLEGSFYNLKISGEVSGFRPSSTGHWYFKLKDQKSSIDAVMFKGSTFRVSTPPKDGDKITVQGSISVYAPRGTYQIIVDKITQNGIGDILAELEERKQLYKKKGWFDEKLKQPLCKFPEVLGVVTSPTAAALQDILQVTRRRAPSLDIVVIPSVVQGPLAAESIAEAIRTADDYLLCDQLIIGRGGGSIEDLLPFSDERVVKAIMNCRIPVISGVGHEIDWALSDYVADMRAPTPSAAAELATKGIFEGISQRETLSSEIAQSVQTKMRMMESKIFSFDTKSLTKMMQNKIENNQLMVAGLERDSENGMQSLLAKTESRLKNSNYQAMANAILNELDSKLATNNTIMTRIQDTTQNTLLTMTHRLHLASQVISDLGPQSILDKGYSIIQNDAGHVVKSTKQTTIDEHIHIRLSDGSILAQVKEK